VPAIRGEEARLVQDRVAETMWTRVGVVRSEEALRAALETFRGLEQRLGIHPPTRRGLEARNLLRLARAVAEAALRRTESRGAHFRADHPERDDRRWARHSTSTPVAA
jgi:succinate dehydrogenase/fumarate reductase flavoprotein subunit